jgi:hypothetical protein
MANETSTGSLTSTTFELPGYTVDQTLGLSWGLIVRSVGIVKGPAWNSVDAEGRAQVPRDAIRTFRRPQVNPARSNYTVT